MFGRPTKVKATSAFISKGRLKCAGALSALPFNPLPYERCPNFRISFNGRWHTVELMEASEVYGWIAADVEDIIDDLAVAPRVELRK